MDFKPEVAMKLAARLNYTPVVPPLRMDERTWPSFWLPQAKPGSGGFGLGVVNL